MSSVSHLAQFQSAPLRFYAHLWFQHKQNHRNCACNRFIVSKGMPVVRENIDPPRTSENFMVKRISLASWSENSILSIRNWTTLRLCVRPWNWFFWTWLVSNTKMANSKETFSIGSCWSPPVSVQRGNFVCDFFVDSCLVYERTDRDAAWFRKSWLLCEGWRLPTIRISVRGGLSTETVYSDYSTILFNEG